MNPELVKLLGILSILLVIPIGGYFQHKAIARKKAQEENYFQKEESSELSESQRVMKEYIEQYKGQYERSSIKQALIGAGNSEEEVESMLNKYF